MDNLSRADKGGQAALDNLPPGKSWLYNEDLAVWAAFEAWARDNLGQGYSLEREEGVYIDRVTVWAYQAWKGRDKLAAQAVAAERERLAALVEHFSINGTDLSMSDVAKLILGRWAAGPGDCDPAIRNAP